MAHEEKSLLRQRMRTLRQGLPPGVQAAAGAGIRNNLSPLLAGRQRVLGFFPARGEPDLLPLYAALMTAGVAVALPAVRNGIMRFRQLADAAFAFPETCHGIPQPDERHPLVECFRPDDLCLVPGLAFTPAGDRLGQGGGYYDRHLATFPGTCVGICYALQVIPRLPVFAHDRPVDYICTERGLERNSRG